MISDHDFLSKALDFAPAQVVPMLCVGDGSQFAGRAQEAISRHGRSISETIAGVVKCGGIGEASALSGLFFHQDFDRQISPLRLWPGQPVWCAWILESEGKIEDFNQCRRILDDHPMRPCAHFLFLKLQAANGFKENPPGWFANLNNCHVFLLSEKESACERSESLLAEALAGYLFSSWLRYCEKTTGNLREAMGLTGNGMVYTLGIGYDSPDYEACKHKWVPRVVSGLIECWLADSEPFGLDAGFESRVSLLKDSLPDKTYRFIEDVRAKGAGIQFTRPEVKRFRIEYFEDVHTPGFSATTFLLSWAERFRLLKKLDEFLRFIVLQSTRVYIAHRINGFGKKFMHKFSAFFQMSEKPDGLLKDLSKRITLARDELKDISQATVMGPPGLRSIEKNIEIIKSKIRKTPSLSGAFLRVSFISVGLIWLLIGSWAWGNGVHPLNDNMMRWLAVASFSAVFTLAAIVFAQWVFFRQATFRADEIARRDIVSGHLVDVCNTIIRVLKEKCGQLEILIEKIEGQLGELESAIRRGFPSSVKSENAGAEPGNPIFDNGFDIIFQNIGSRLIISTHERIRVDLLAQWPDFNVNRWQALTAKAALQCVQEALGKLTYDECASAAGVSDLQKKEILRRVVNQSEIPAFPMSSNANCPVWLIAPASWKKYSDQPSEVIYLKSAALLVISPMPINNIRIR